MNQLQIIEHKGIRVLTTQQLADQYETTNELITKNFNRNKERYTEGKHFICLEGNDLKMFKANGQIDLLPNINKLYLWTEKGALLHAKSLGTDKAWEVYEELVDTYYKAKDVFEGMSKELQAIFIHDKKIQAVVEHINNTNERVNKLENNMTIDYNQQKELKSNVQSKVWHVLGGRVSQASKDKSLKSRVYSRLWHDFYDFFGINAYANTPVVRYAEAKEYIMKWKPSTNMRLEIDAANKEDLV